MATDRDYEKLTNGIVYDTQTGLEGCVGPDDATDWNRAKMWVEKLSVDGGDWRMPAAKALEGLYTRRAGDRNMTPLLNTVGWLVWSEEKQDSGCAWYFRFSIGKRVTPSMTPTTEGGVLQCLPEDIVTWSAIENRDRLILPRCFTLLKYNSNVMQAS